MSKPILVIPSGLLTTKEKASIEEAGYITIITDEPQKIKFITPNEESLMGLTKEKLLAGMMRIIYNENDNCNREWLLRIIFNEMGVKKDSK